MKSCKRPRKDAGRRGGGYAMKRGNIGFRASLAFLCLILAEPAFALDTMSLLGEGPARELLEGKKPIFVETSGIVPVNFNQALGVLRHPAFMTNVQTAYNEMIDDDGKPEFTIQQTSTNTYFYVNRKGERTDITELARRQTSASCFDIVLYSAGKRSFGNYQAVIHVQVVAEGENASRYVAMVHAYPENAVSRFFARHLGLIERYFNKKTSLLSTMISTITLGLCETENATAAKQDADAADVPTSFAFNIPKIRASE